MRNIKIRWDEKAEEYYFICPFCKKRTTLPEDTNEDCAHILYAHETVNGQVIGDYPYIQDEVIELLAENGPGYLEEFDEFLAEMTDFVFDDDEYDEDSEDEEQDIEGLAADFIEQGYLSAEVLIKLLKKSKLKWLLKDMVVASLVEVSGIGGTYYLLHPTANTGENG